LIGPHWFRRSERSSQQRSQEWEFAVYSCHRTHLLYSILSVLTQSRPPTLCVAFTQCHVFCPLLQLDHHVRNLHVFLRRILRRNLEDDILLVIWHRFLAHMLDKLTHSTQC